MAEKLISMVDKYKKIILDTQDYIWKNPETGYREVKTSKYLEKEFEKLGYNLTKAGNIPGFYTTIDTGRPGPTVLIMGELDSLICPEHPDADKETGAVHCCGHSAQCAALLGVAAVLSEPGALDALSGKIRLCAVPAEELIEIEYRSNLKKEGIIKYFGGKTEFLYRGYFDDVDLAFMVHTTTTEHFAIRKGSVGCLAKRVIYKGISAHAGGFPWNGVNALYAANLGISAINSIRETFKEEDIIRIHPIITKGGNAVNAIPDEVIIESYIRGSSFSAIEAANKKANRALTGAALSLGANIDIIDNPGYGPLVNCDTLADVYEDAAKYFPDVEFSRNNIMGSGSTDMGDLSRVMPAIHPYVGGAIGTSHGADYFIKNPELACIGSAKIQLATLYLLLSDNAKRATKIKENYTPEFASFSEYFKYIDTLADSGDRICYNRDGSAVVR